MKKDILIILLLILPAFAVLLQPGYFSMHDDLQSMRQFQLHKCFQDGQFPCRWSPDLGYGFGYPMFNFYPPLPYLLGQPFVWLGFQYIDVVKIIGVLGWILSALFMYLLGRSLWGRLGGLVAALFYTYAPYHSVDFYVRGAVNEFWAMVWYPAIFWSTYHLVKSPVQISRFRWAWLTALFVSMLMLSHNPMLMIFAPVLVAWCLFWLWQIRPIRLIRSISYLAISALLALGLAAFFTLPVLFESQYVSLWTLTSGYFNYLAHFADLNQIFLQINWGYGASELGPVDGMSFAIGYLHWLVPVLVCLGGVFHPQLKKYRSLLFLLALFTLASLFLTHSKSTFIWQSVKQLEFLQFPWRFLTISVFAASLLSGAFVKMAGKYTPVLLVLLILLNANYFVPREWYPDMTDAKKFSGKSWQLLVTSGIFDYLPKWAPLPPADPRGQELNIIGRGLYSPLEFRSNYQSYRVTIVDKPAVVEIQTFYFPGWQVFVDGRRVDIDPARDPLLGRMQVDLPPGTYTLEAKFTDTPVRSAGNIVSLFSWLFWLISFPLIFAGKIPLWQTSASQPKSTS